MLAWRAKNGRKARAEGNQPRRLDEAAALERGMEQMRREFAATGAEVYVAPAGEAAR